MVDLSPEISQYAFVLLLIFQQIRFVVMSDTHDMQYKFDFPIPEGDVFIHGGDFSGVGRVKEVKAFNDWLGRLPHPHKIVIAGNHEVTFDPRMNDSERSKRVSETVRFFE